MSISYFHFHFDGAALCVVFVSLFVFVLIILYQQRIKTKREHKTYPKSGAYERAKRTYTQTHTLAHISSDVRRANEHNWPDIRVALAPREPAVPEQRTQQKHVLRQILVHMHTYVSRYAHTSVRTDRAEVTYQN